MPAYADNFLNITSTNATVTLMCDGVIPNPVRLQNFGTDQSVSIDEVTIAEGRMGVDGGFAAGHTPSPTSMTITLEANSPSTQHMEAIAAASMGNRTVYNVTVTVTLPSIGARYIYSNGTMMNATLMSNPKKLQEPTTWKFQFARFEVETL